METTPKVSIIIPTYNRANIISQTLDIVLRQNYPNWECIIVDDSSSDYTTEMIGFYLTRDDRFCYIQQDSKKSLGPSACRNIGVDEANGEYVIFLDSDDLLSKECLSNRISFVSRNSHYDFWIFKTEIFYNHTSNLKLFNFLPSDKDEISFYLKSFLDGATPFNIMAPLWKKDFLHKIGKFDEEFRLYEDPEIHIRALLDNPKIITDTLGSVDSFYRIDITEKRKILRLKKYQSAVLNNKYKLAYKYRKEIKYYEGDFLKNAIRDFAIPFNSLNHIIKLSFLGLRTGSLPLFFFVKTLFLYPYHLAGLQDYKGLGYYKIRNWVFR